MWLDCCLVHGSIPLLNGERFAGLNFCVFQECHESFSVNMCVHVLSVCVCVCVLSVSISECVSDV